MARSSPGADATIRTPTARRLRAASSRSRRGETAIGGLDVSLSPVQVSVVVVTWNSARWLTRTLDRLADQRGVRLEVLVVDNASSDQSVELAERHPVVQRVIRRPNNGGYATG